MIPFFSALMRSKCTTLRETLSKRNAPSDDRAFCSFSLESHLLSLSMNSRVMTESAAQISVMRIRIVQLDAMLTREYS